MNVDAALTPSSGEQVSAARVLVSVMRSACFLAMVLAARSLSPQARLRRYTRIECRGARPPPSQRQTRSLPCPVSPRPLVTSMPSPTHSGCHLRRRKRWVRRNPFRRRPPQISGRSHVHLACMPASTDSQLPTRLLPVDPARRSLSGNSSCSGTATNASCTLRGRVGPPRRRTGTSRG